MKYYFQKIGERIKSERLSLGWSQSKLGSKIGNRYDPAKALDVKTIRGYENGNNEPPLYVLGRMCELFNCELGYLLCEPGYEEKTRMETDIHEAVGLTRDSIYALQKMLATKKLATDLKANLPNVEEDDPSMADNLSQELIIMDFVNDVIKVLPDAFLYLSLARSDIKKTEYMDGDVKTWRTWFYSAQEDYMDVVRKYVNR